MIVIKWIDPISKIECSVIAENIRYMKVALDMFCELKLNAFRPEYIEGGLVEHESIKAYEACGIFKVTDERFGTTVI